ncbi:MAG: 3-deoxy-D-manno-octulosonic acid transferase, partial [Desulfobacteraceae bacterium]|nr:3-deoxy-D-manno-octulosonic acid transferase [Desulfobacteraceae bacterium]
MFMFIYHFLWTLGSIFWIPIAALTGKKRLQERLALNLPPAAAEAGNIWIHALSVGEVVSAIPLVKTLRLKYPAKDIVFTVTTAKGMSVARNQLGGSVAALLTMPVDFWWCVRQIVNCVRPSVFILVETDIWPGLITHLRRRGIKTILVNGRISPRTFRSYLRFPPFTRMMFERLELCLMQSDLDSERLLQAGIDPHKVRTVGNIKFDHEWVPFGEEERQKWLSLLGLGSEDIVWVAGSTHQGEEETLLTVHKKLKLSFPLLRLILAPRRIEQSGEIHGLAQGMGLKAVLKTELPYKRNRPYDVLILNTLGELGRIYGLGKVSFVGGSLVRIGGHNLLEPASFGCPVLFGPHTHNFVLMSESLVEAGGGWRVKDGNELYEAMETLLGDAAMRTRLGRDAKKFVEKNRGALESVVAYIALNKGEAGGLH